MDYLNVYFKGYVNIDELQDLLREDTMLVSIGAVNSETGAIQNLKEIEVRVIKSKK